MKIKVNNFWNKMWMNDWEKRKNGTKKSRNSAFWRNYFNTPNGLSKMEQKMRNSMCDNVLLPLLLLLLQLSTERKKELFNFFQIFSSHFPHYVTWIRNTHAEVCKKKVFQIDFTSCYVIVDLQCTFNNDT